MTREEGYFFVDKEGYFSMTKRPALHREGHFFKGGEGYFSMTNRVLFYDQ